MSTHTPHREHDSNYWPAVQRLVECVEAYRGYKDMFLKERTFFEEYEPIQLFHIPRRDHEPYTTEGPRPTPLWCSTYLVPSGRVTSTGLGLEIAAGQPEQGTVPSTTVDMGDQVTCRVHSERWFAR